jgi:cyclopropane-fatty-acyl-phospholipid synthase
LPSLRSLKKISSKSGLVIDSHELYGEHYSNTLQKWRKSFLNSWVQISKQGFNKSFKNMWDFYLSYCEAGFKSKNIDLIQLTLCNK